ncbi:hypothetical protein E6Q11_04390 [Candidatus Dojkabacteria bacterium]|uniref:Uncharacterized protein n=1 Tax=Candidatus Dojkabacteria bacterium TaxID=2099670 RepID=A0A5C7J5N3_9BACT|nr:MAG: hypothetical protein E6Q11_04390 [Candidatus Dojkabacteria bacterium]
MSKFYKKNKNLVRPLMVTLGILLIPIFGNLFTEGWTWGPLDFLIMGVLIYTTGVLVELANKKIKETNYKLAAIGGIILMLILIWIELATDAVSRFLTIY